MPTTTATHRANYSRPILHSTPSQTTRLVKENHLVFGFFPPQFLQWHQPRSQWLPLTLRKLTQQARWTSRAAAAAAAPTAAARWRGATAATTAVSAGVRGVVAAAARLLRLGEQVVVLLAFLLFLLPTLRGALLLPQTLRLLLVLANAA